MAATSLLWSRGSGEVNVRKITSSSQGCYGLRSLYRESRRVFLVHFPTTHETPVGKTQALNLPWRKGMQYSTIALTGQISGVYAGTCRGIWRFRVWGLGSRVGTYGVQGGEP